MRYPGYLLNPGDLFQVDVARVMYATGAPKAPVQAKTKETKDEGEEEESQLDVEKESTKKVAESDAAAAEEDADVDDRDPREVLKDLLSQAKSILASPKENVGAKRKQDLRAFTNTVKRTLSRSGSSTILTDSLEAQFAELQNQLRIRRETKQKGTSSLPSEQKSGEQGAETAEQRHAVADQSAEEDNETLPAPGAEEEDVTTISEREYNELFAALTSMQENPIDDSKPYTTPWMPRDYMSAFAFIPRYLEVNQNICAAVYLRHPVARPGLAEVPTPFAESTNASAFAWYLRRR